MKRRAGQNIDPAWFKDAVIYEVHVRSFFDSSQNGHGDFRGLTGKLDYLQDLGVNALWLLPFYPSPLRDDGYDIADYCDIHPAYGTLADFRVFLREAHNRNIRVITELVLNHTSDQHAWFQRARRAKPGTSMRDFYVWSDTPDKFAGTRIIFQDFETSNWTWDHVAGAYYWHRFYAHQPDLNYDNPQVEAELLRVVDFWLSMGVDGLRLDAVPYLYEREGAGCENLPETFALLARLRAHVDARHPGRMLLSEVNQWPEDAARYFGKGDMSHMIFHFPLMTRLFMALEMEERAPITDILEQTPKIPENCQWAIFLRNHDELTLEMVSEEERDFMYQVYANDRRARINQGIRRRLAPLLHNDRNKIELMNILLMTMPGSPVIYYGDEIGMGDNYYLGDRNGVRTPMQWSPDRNAGFSRVNPQQLYLPAVIDPEYHYQSVNVENQQRNPSSLLWWMKQLIAMRKRHPALARGGMTFIRQGCPKVLAFMRPLGDECLLVVANLSRHPQATRLDLAAFAGHTPVEALGGTLFPAITSQPYPLTLAPHGCYILDISGGQGRAARQPSELSLRRADPGGVRFLDARLKAALQGSILPEYLRRKAEAAGRNQQILATHFLDALPVGSPNAPAWLCVLEVKYAGGSSENHVLLLSFVDAEQGRRVAKEQPKRFVCMIYGPQEAARQQNGADDPQDPDTVDWVVTGAVVEGAEERRGHAGLLKLFAQRRRIQGRQGEFTVAHGRLGKQLRLLAAGQQESEVLPDNSANTMVVYGRQALLKIFRRTASGANPDLEIVRYLTEKAGFQNTPGFIAALEYARPGLDPVVVAMLRGFVLSETTAWDLCATALGIFFNQVLSGNVPVPDGPAGQEPPLAGQLPEEPTITAMRLIGRRTAEMHLALAKAKDDPAFVPEPFDKAYRRAVFQDINGKARRILGQLEQARPGLTQEESELAGQLLNLREHLADRLRAFRDTPVQGLKIRVHGEYDLRHLLFTGRDFMVVDFEGRTTLSLSARRLKRSPLRDVCDLLGSLGKVAYATLHDPALARPEDSARLRPWAVQWSERMGGHFLHSYLETAGVASFLPQDQAGVDRMLATFRIDQAFYELGQALKPLPRCEIGASRGRSLWGALDTLRSLLTDQTGSSKETLL